MGHWRLVMEKEQEQGDAHVKVAEQCERLRGDPPPVDSVLLQDPRLAHPANRSLQVSLLQAGQQAMGNQAVQRILRTRTSQDRLTLGRPGDAWEREADRLAGEAVQSPEATAHLRLKGSEDAPPAQGTIAPIGGSNADPESAAQLIPGDGQALPSSLRSLFGPRLGLDFSQVRIHTDAPAAEAARTVHARAYTLGQHIVFGAGEYRPETLRGTRMIAHELVHVAQNARTGQTLLQKWGEGEVDQAAIEQAISAVSHVTASSVRGMPREELERLRSMLNCTLETAFVASGSPNYRHLVEQRALMEGELERRDVEQAHQDIIDQVRILSTTWRTVLRQELASQGVADIEDWALEAIGSFVGLPYMNAHELYGGPDQWRAAYQRAGVYPPAVVCDQLGELTQRLARGMTEYGPQGLTGHYAFYQARDPSFPAVPGNASDPRCAPGATLFHTTGTTWNFREQATRLDTDLYNSGLPRPGGSAEVNAVRQRASDLSGILRGRWSGARGKANLLNALDRLTGRPRWATFAADLSGLRADVDRESAESVGGLLRAFADRVYEAGGRTLAEHFEPDRRLSHEFTLAALVDPGPRGRLLFLDTYGPQGSGTMAIRPSTLGAERASHWGFFQPARPRRIPIYTPYSGVALRVRGAGREHTFDDIWLSSPIPPPIVFRYALQSVLLPGLSAYLDFFMEGRRCESLLVGTLGVERGQARFSRPQWMTERMEQRQQRRR